jgi:two-component system, NtrC family, nitrogen regulation sensor histidine kinase NtrY
LDDQRQLTFIIVLEDTSELLRAQKMEAWQEVARSVAHEIKNPLTPIALSAQRILIHIERSGLPDDARRIIRECAAAIDDEVSSLKSLVNEFSHAARFPAAQPRPSDLNDAIENSLAIFHGRLRDTNVILQLDATLPPVNIDPEQFKRVLVNLIDNAAEAMENSAVRRLLISTRPLPNDAVELVIADTGPGISTENKDRLFVPYFSTKNRGTGLGLSIVNHILADHKASIRVEDNRPTGAAFILEIPVAETITPSVGASLTA